MINVYVKPGTYVVAVSGGVDSMVLLDIVRQKSDLKLVVAHVDHGIRSDSHMDRELVERYAMSHNIQFEYTQLSLGSIASEEAARRARYDFLRRIRRKYNASAILTAHHKDDLLETAVINLLRGTGWRGLCSLRSTAEIMRPLLSITKLEIEAYAREQALLWYEDTTNNNQKYLRNYVRHTVLAHAPQHIRDQFYEIIVRQNDNAAGIDAEIAAWLRDHASEAAHAIALPRYDLIMMPQHVAHEIIQGVLRHKSGGSIERPLADAVVLFCKVAKSGKVMQVNAHWQLRAEKRHVIVEPRPTVVS